MVQSIQSGFSVQPLSAVQAATDRERALQMMQAGLVRQLVSTYHPDQFNSVYAAITPRGQINQVSAIQLMPPQQLSPTLGSIQMSINTSSDSPKSQLTALGQKYGVTKQTNESFYSYQKKVAKAIITFKAQEYGIPLNVAMGIAGNESGWTMWKDIDKGTVIQGRNVRDGVLKSTDWGVMQINDKAHAKAFPRAKTDMEYNIDYGLKFLARQRQNIQGSLGLGLGDWDRTVASYNLGHNPKTENSLNIANRYVSHVKKQSVAYA